MIPHIAVPARHPLLAAKRAAVDVADPAASVPWCGDWWHRSRRRTNPGPTATSAPGVPVIDIRRPAPTAADTLGRDSGMDRIEFWYAVMEVVPGRGRSGFVGADGTVWFVEFGRDVMTFPSLDHFLECDALLSLASRVPCWSTETPADANAYRGRGRFRLAAAGRAVARVLPRAVSRA